MGNGSEGLRVIEDFCPSSQPGTLRKKIICTKKVYEIDDAEICLRIYSIFFSCQLWNTVVMVTKGEEGGGIIQVKTIIIL